MECIRSVYVFVLFVVVFFFKPVTSHCTFSVAVFYLFGFGERPAGQGHQFSGTWRISKI